MYIMRKLQFSPAVDMEVKDYSKFRQLKVEHTVQRRFATALPQRFYSPKATDELILRRFGK